MRDLSTDLHEQRNEPPVRSRRSLLALTGLGAAGVAALAASSSAAAAPTPSADPDDPNVLSVRDFGATGDGATDDLAAINAALAAAAALVQVPKLAGTGLAPTVVFPAAVGYRVTGTVTVPPRVAVVMHASVLYDGPVDAPGLVIGSTAAPTMGLTFKLDISRFDGPNYADWSSDDHVGIRLVNFDECVVWAMRSQGFAIGLQCLGNGGGFAYNEIHLGFILDARVG